MRLYYSFAVLVTALVAVCAWVIWQDASPEWRVYQRDRMHREIARLEVELDSVRTVLGRPEARYQLEQLDGQIKAAGADASARAIRLAEIDVRLDNAQLEIVSIRDARRRAERRLLEPATVLRRRDLVTRLERIQQAYAHATGAWPPDTLRLNRLWTTRDSLARKLAEIEGPVQVLRDSLRTLESAAQDLRIEASRLASTRDSLETLRARLLEPRTARESALSRLRHQKIRIREIVSLDGLEVARCPTCHGAMDDAPGAHPALVAEEVFREVPCTVCHRGRGRALTVKDAHRGLLDTGDFSAGPNSLRARIERLRSRDPAERERAREELARLTGADPATEMRGGPAAGNPDSAEAARWYEWWRTAEPYFEPGDGQTDAGDGSVLRAAGIDPWAFSARGRPLRYVGSQKCLACHETLHREHSRRWMATKFRSIERLMGEPRPERCFACHTTGYDPTTGKYAEPGVTCEGCHGPGERYNEMMVVGQELVGKGDEVRGRALLNASARLAREAVNLRTVLGDRGDANICVSCHHPWEHREGGPAILELEKPPAARARRPNSPLVGG